MSTEQELIFDLNNLPRGTKNIFIWNSLSVLDKNNKNDYMNQLNKTKNSNSIKEGKIMKKYHYYTETDFDRLIKENKDAKGFIVIGKDNAVMSLKNYNNIPIIKIIEQNGNFKYVDIFNSLNHSYVADFTMRIISKENIQWAIEEIKNHRPKEQKIKKEVLVFE